MQKSWRFGLFLALSAGLLTAATAVRVGNERRLNFNDGWRFYKGEAAGAEQPSFADQQWTELRLPHDWAIEGPFAPDLRDGLVSEILHPSGLSQGSPVPHRVRRRHVERACVDQRSGAGRPA